MSAFTLKVKMLGQILEHEQCPADFTGISDQQRLLHWPGKESIETNQSHT